MEARARHRHKQRSKLSYETVVAIEVVPFVPAVVRNKGSLLKAV